MNSKKVVWSLTRDLTRSFCPVNCIGTHLSGLHMNVLDSIWMYWTAYVTICPSLDFFRKPCSIYLRNSNYYSVSDLDLKFSCFRNFVEQNHLFCMRSENKDKVSLVRVRVFTILNSNHTELLNEHQLCLKRTNRALCSFFGYHTKFNTQAAFILTTQQL